MDVDRATRWEQVGRHSNVGAAGYPSRDVGPSGLPPALPTLPAARRARPARRARRVRFGRPGCPMHGAPAHDGQVGSLLDVNVDDADKADRADCAAMDMAAVA